MSYVRARKGGFTMDSSDHAASQDQQFYWNYEEYRRQLYRYALGKMRNKAEAEEITDEAIVRFITSMEKRRWRDEIRNVKAYLIRIASRLCTIRLLRQSVETPLDNDDNDEQSGQTTTVLERKAMQDNEHTSRVENGIYYKELLHSLPKAIFSDLTEYELKLLYMHVVKEMKAEEMAKALGEDTDRIRYQINKLLAKLRYRARKSGGLS
jgi:RNA polymerase sigma factor (sigma-70 family)